MPAPKDRLIVALDVPSTGEARALIDKIAPAVGVYKIGLELLYAGGVEFAKDLAAAGSKVFVDAKLLDIPKTVERATSNIATLGVAFLTVHGLDAKTLEAAREGRGESNMALLAVTVLTSLDQSDLNQQGIDMTPRELVLRRALLAQEAGFDGVVASGQEAGPIREATGSNFLIVTPGIRPEGGAAQDQARVTTPAMAIAAGADYLVVGRPITQAGDPLAAAEAIVGEIGKANS
jgi:orotidine-5'-phosphate decarboxylase